jgi:sulfur relay protein TusB/DsrH
MLYQDAVLAAGVTDETREWLRRFTDAGVKVHALEEDLMARGIRRTLDGIDIIDYGGWVDLVERFQPVSC